VGFGREVAGSNPAPATRFSRSSRLFVYAQAVDQHVWSATSVFMGTVCGDLLNPCVRSMGRVAQARAADTLRLRCGGDVPAECCIGMRCACLCRCPTQSDSGLKGPLVLECLSECADGSKETVSGCAARVDELVNSKAVLHGQQHCRQLLDIQFVASGLGETGAFDDVDDQPPSGRQERDELLTMFGGRELIDCCTTFVTCE
jgi:hypothetical protein